jgi:hypothetical protein
MRRLNLRKLRIDRAMSAATECQQQCKRQRHKEESFARDPRNGATIHYIGPGMQGFEVSATPIILQRGQFSF